MYFLSLGREVEGGGGGVVVGRSKAHVVGFLDYE